MNKYFIYDNEYYKKRVENDFLENINLFKNKKIIWLFMNINYNTNLTYKKKIIKFKIFNDYKITNVENNLILNKTNLYNIAKDKFKLNNFITFPICIFKNITIEGILLINSNDNKLNEIYLEQIYLTNNLDNNKEIISNILDYKFNLFNKNIKIKIEKSYINLNIKLLLKSIIPYF